MMRQSENRAGIIRIPVRPIILTIAITGLCMAAGTSVIASKENVLVARPRPGAFLFAIPELRDPNFLHTVILLVDYDKNGAMGLIINRPTEVSVDQALPEVEGIKGLSVPLYIGGPVSRGSILALLRTDKPPEEIRKVFDNVYLTGNRETLAETLKRENPDKTVRIYSGYAGWGPGQLDREIKRGDWIIADADSEMVFSEDPSAVWPEILNLQEQIEVRWSPPRILPSMNATF